MRDLQATISDSQALIVHKLLYCVAHNQGIRRELLKSVDKYNTYGPHQGLKGDTSMEDITKIQEISFLSQAI
jgi:hypothetical protein